MSSQPTNSVRFVYNLEFPWEIKSFQVEDYTFTQVSDYDAQYQRLSHLVQVNMVPLNTGENVITAHVNIPTPEKDGLIGIERPRPTHKAIKDVELLLTLFTSRNVFCLDQKPTSDMLITADPRKHMLNSVLDLSLRGHQKWEATKQRPNRNLGFEKWLNKVYALVRSEKWRQQYGNGIVLHKIKEALSTWNGPSAFQQCFSIWEYLFSLENSTSKSNKVAALDKLCWLLRRYYWATDFTETERDHLRVFVKIRNGLVHEAQIPTIKDAHKLILLFIELTESIIARILELEPSETMSTLEHFKLLIAGQAQPPSLDEVMANSKRR